jgi:uncharacterized protein YdeI (YjbR/CyaY-like superfamily)
VTRAVAGAAASAPRFFASGADFRTWLEGHHASTAELWIGFWKANTGRAGLTYLEAVDEALCFGWIDGLRKGFDEHAYVQRFTPRRATSTWSAINLRKVEGLIAAGRMHAAGLAAHESRDPARTGLYSFERSQPAALEPALEKRFRANRAAWRFFGEQPPGYRRVALHWVTSAKRLETRERRLGALIAASAKGLRLPALAGKPPGVGRGSPPPRRRRG